MRAMFDSIAGRYDLVNDVLSLFMDRRWRRVTADSVRARAGDVALDLGVGTGELGSQLAPGVRVVGVDVSAEMLRRARGRGRRRRLDVVQGSAFRLPFADGGFDAVVSGFVLRNLDDLPGAFAELARVVRPGGRIALVDITQPRKPALRFLMNGYLGTAAPLLGRITGRADAYRYLARSATTLPPAREVCTLLSTAGFGSCGERSLAPGFVTLWTATRL
ncbi:MAG: ubiquinone/menaquinone biosynthesis methyltransferase [Actinomycetota bacterium]